MMKRFILLVLLTLLAFESASASAQVAVPATRKLDFTLYDKTYSHNGRGTGFHFPLQGYAPLDFKGLSQLYFKASVLPTDNRDIITEYLQVNECKVFEAAYKDDFLWPEVFKSTTKFLDANKRTFSSQFTVLQPLAFDRYDPDKEWFSVTGDTQYLNTTILTFADFMTVNTPCARNFPIKYIPGLATVKLGHPFSLTNLKMSPNLAREYIRYMQERAAKTEVLGIPRNRFAYIKFFLNITGFDATHASKESVSFLGDVDGYIIFADKDETLPLHEWVNPRILEKEGGSDSEAVAEPQAEPSMIPGFDR